VTSAATRERTPDLDLARMRRERLGKLQRAMEVDGTDALVLSGNTAVRYATGAQLPSVEGERAVHEPTIALVLPEGPPHLYTASAEAAPPELPADHVHGPLLVEFPAGVVALAGALGEIVGTGEVRVGFDDLSAATLVGLPSLAPKVTIVDAGAVVAAAKVCKTSDEVECIRRAQRINELAMYDVYAAVRPGARQTELSQIFYRRIFELGATANILDPVWQVMAPSIEEGPFTVHGDVAFPLATTDHILRRGDVVMNDTGIHYEGYCSDFGRTWTVGRDPTPRQRDQFERWKDVVARLLAEVRPGTTGSRLTQVAAEPGVDRRPWLDHFWLIHGVGVDSAEMPLIGTHLGEQFDRSIVLAPGMVLVLEPVIWDDGYAGYRSEEVVEVTEDGFRLLSSFPYLPFEEGPLPW
jgi:Xaa-Pro dipeptidase